MKTHEMVSRMAFLVFDKSKIRQHSAKWQQKLIFLKLFLKIHPTKREYAFDYVNHISFVTWSAAKTKKLEFVLNLWTVRRWNN